MLINYIKAALASWYRRKVFTMLTILGIAFSIVLTTCAATYWAMLNSPQAPESKKEQMQIVTPKVRNTEKNRTKRGFDIKQIKAEPLGVNLYTVFSRNGDVDVNINQFESEHDVIATDGNFFQAFDFDFISGKGYANDVITDEGIPLVIARSMAEKYYGTTECVGETFMGDGKKFLIKGVISPPGPWSLFYQYEMFMLRDISEISFMPSIAFFTANDAEQAFLDRKLVELSTQLTASMDDHVVTLKPESYLGAYANIRDMHFMLDPERSIPIIILVVLLPVICMVNLFRSMVVERIEEMGIRKSFGALSIHITMQFIVESILLTIISGVLAIAFSIIFWKSLLEVEYMVVLRDIFTWRVFAFCLLAFLITGAMTGYFSSLKLAKGSIVKYLSLNPA